MFLRDWFDHQRPNRYVPPVVISSVKKHMTEGKHTDIVSIPGAGTLEHIELPFSENTLTFEFAALNLRVRHIMVIGHSGCGGIRACLEHDVARQTEAQFISNWMSMLDTARDEVRTRLATRPVGELVDALEREGVKTSLANLRTFPCIQILEGRGRVSLYGAHFDISSGALSVLNEGTGDFVDV